MSNLRKFFQLSSLDFMLLYILKEKIEKQKKATKNRMEVSRVITPAAEEIGIFGVFWSWDLQSYNPSLQNLKHQGYSRMG
jgi:hypothetical protein